MIDPSPERIEREEGRADESENKVVCPICGAAAVQEKCKLVCRSEICRGRVVMNCSEF
jgi:hypothetical protein